MANDRSDDRPPDAGGSRQAGDPRGATRTRSRPHEDDEELAEQVAAMRAELASSPVEVVVANHCYGLFELAAVYLSQQPPLLSQARLAIDALGSLVGGLEGRLGDAESPLKDGLSQLRLAYVQIDGAQRAGAERPPRWASTAEPNGGESSGERTGRHRGRRQRRQRDLTPTTSSGSRRRVTGDPERRLARSPPHRPTESGTRHRPGADGRSRTDRRLAVRSFIGLSIGLVGPRANLAVSGVLITLYVQQRASGALAVTFALTARPAPQLADLPGRRTLERPDAEPGGPANALHGGQPHRVMGVATWMFTVVQGYWLLVLFIVHRQPGRRRCSPSPTWRWCRRSSDAADGSRRCS